MTALMAALSAIFYAPGGYAQTSSAAQDPFIFGGSVFSGIEYSDNLLLLPDEDGAESFSASTRLSVFSLLRRQKFRGILNGSVDYVRIVDPGPEIDRTNFDRDSLNVGLSAGGTFEIKDNFLYTDISASVRQRPTGSSVLSSNRPGAPGDQFQSDVLSVSVSPYLSRQFPNFSEISLRYRYSQIAVRGQDNVPAVDLQNNQIVGFEAREEGDSAVNEVVAAYNTGRLFDRLRFEFTGQYQDISDEADGRETDLEIVSGSVSSEVVLGRRMTFISTIGYDEVTTSEGAGFEDDDLSGLNYSVGLRFRPGRRTNIGIEYGERFGGDQLRIDASYTLSSRLRLAINADRSLSTGNLRGLDQISFAQSQALQIASELASIQAQSASEFTNQVFAVNSALSEFTSQTGGIELSNSVTASVVGRLKNIGYSASLGYVDSERGVSVISAEEEERETLITSFGLSRSFGRRLTLSTDMNFIQNTTTNIFNTPEQCIAAVPGLLQLIINDPTFDLFSFCTGGVDNEIEDLTLSLEASYLIWGNVGLQGQYTYRRRDIDAQGIPVAVENAISVGVNVPF